MSEPIESPDVAYQLGHISGQITMLASLVTSIQNDINDRSKRNDDRLNGYEARIRALEQFKFWLMGICVVLGGAANIFVDLIK